MGIIIKQTIKGSIWSYLGVLLGFVTTTYLYTQYLTPEVVGLFSVLVSIATLAYSFTSLGMNGVAGRLFPYFRSKSNGHNGFLFISLLVQAVGFLAFLALYYIFKEQLIASNIDKSPLLADYIYLILPLTFFLMIFNFFDSYNKLLYDAVLGTFLQEFLQRVFIFGVIILYVFKLISLDLLIISYVVAFSLKAIVIVVYLFFRGEINLKPALHFITKPLRKEMIDVAFFYIIGGLGSLVVFNIDKIVINQLLDLHNTGVYTIAFYFGTLVVIPSRPLLKIAGTLIAEAWSKNDVEHIKTIYYKSCINQFVIGGFLFLGIWANIDNILTVLGNEYLQSKWVIFFIGIGYLFDMLTGVNGTVIAFSKNYRKNFEFILILVGVSVSLLYLLIPKWGIVGAAIAIAIALFLNNLMRFFYLKRKYQMQPFNLKFVWIGIFYTTLYFSIDLIPQQKLIIDLILRGSIILFASAIFFYFVPISDDLSLIKMKLVYFFKTWINDKF